MTLVSTGIMAHEALRAAEQLATAGISARVQHYPTIKPFDVAPLLSAAQATRAIVTAEEHSIIGGLGEAVAAAILEAGLGAPLRRIGVRDVFGESGQSGELLDKHGLRARNIAHAAQSLLSAVSPAG